MTRSHRAKSWSCLDDDGDDGDDDDDADAGDDDDDDARQEWTARYISLSIGSG